MASLGSCQWVRTAAAAGVEAGVACYNVPERLVRGRWMLGKSFCHR